MSSDYCSQLGLLDCIHDFVVASADRELTEDHWTQFERLLWENDDACRLYLEYVQESDFLQIILESIDLVLYQDTFSRGSTGSPSDLGGSKPDTYDGQNGYGATSRALNGFQIPRTQPAARIGKSLAAKLSLARSAVSLAPTMPGFRSRPRRTRRTPSR